MLRHSFVPRTGTRNRPGVGNVVVIRCMFKRLVIVLVFLFALMPSASAMGSCLIHNPVIGDICLPVPDQSSCIGLYFWSTINCQPVCGNGHTESGEACDDGNTADGDGCSATCTVTSVCGNGVVEWGEMCDDGNTKDGDGCSAECSFCQVFFCSDPALSCDPMPVPFPPYETNLCELMGNTCTGGIDHDCDGSWEAPDCDDYNAAVHPGAAEISCNGIDEDCSGADRCDDIPVPEFPLQGLHKALRTLHGGFS